MSKIYKIAIVEDEAYYLNSLKDMLHQYGNEKTITFNITEYRDIETFLFEYKGGFDIVFMDIELPGMNGMDGAHRLREIDSVVTLIFVTNMAQFAVKGYEVSALDYILKPVSYKNFSVKLSRALSNISKQPEKQITVNGVNGVNVMRVCDIFYIEVIGHHLIFHLSDDKQVDVCGSLSNLEEKLKEYGFVRCNSCYLINMKYIASVSENDITMMDETVLAISRRKRKAFMDSFTIFLGRGV